MICHMGASVWAIRALCVIGLLAGAACLRWPGKVIAFEQWFYARINWRMEPISMPKEIRNTRLMGLALVLLSAAGLLAGA